MLVLCCVNELAGTTRAFITGRNSSATLPLPYTQKLHMNSLQNAFVLMDVSARGSSKGIINKT